MTIYYVFSDESGQYKKGRTERDNRRTPYYIRINLLIKAENWKQLNSDFLALKRRWGLSRQEEIKWDYIWEIRKCQDAGKKPHKEIESFVQRYRWQSLLNYFEELLGLLQNLPYVQIIITLTDNRICHRIGENHLIKFHLKNAMQRIQMELQSDDEDLAVVFFDSINEKEDKLLCEAYSEIYNSGDFIRNYSCIQDCLHFEQSNQSVGIQLADCIAGITMNRLKGREESTRLFYEHAYPSLRRSNIGELMGYGVIEIPTNIALRDQIDQLLEGQS